MAVERKTFLWVGNDRAAREAQIAAGISNGKEFGATGIGSWNNQFFGGYGQQNDWVGIGNDAVTGEGTIQSMKALDVFWNNKENWAERVVGFSGTDGSSGEADHSQYYYSKATRIPHRADHVIFEFVVGNTGNGLLRNYIGQDKDDYTGLMDTKPFNAPLSPCLFGGQSRPTDGLSGEGSIWVNADTTGSSAANRQGPLSSVKVLPSYFHHAYGVMDKSSDFYGFADRLEATVWGQHAYGNRWWGGRVSPMSASGISGASFGNVQWNVGQTGINLKALDVQLNSPYRMGRLTATNSPFYPESITNSEEDGGESITLHGAFGQTPRTICKLSHAESIVNLNVGCRDFVLESGNVINCRISDMYMPFASDSTRKIYANGGDAFQEIGGVPEKIGSAPLFRSFKYRGTISRTFRCDPCWYNALTSFTENGSDEGTIGSPDIIFGPYHSVGIFGPRVTSPGTITAYPQFSTGFNLTSDDVDSGVEEDPEGNGLWWGLFSAFQIKGTGNQRFSSSLVKVEEFNPRWDVVTSVGNPTSTIGRRGFNNKFIVDSGCTITNLNLSAGQFVIGEGHAGGDTFEAANEVGDIVILNGFSEEKSFLNGEHPTVPSFSGFYIGKGGVNETGQNYQIRSKDAEFDFGQGVYVRTGPETTGISGAGFAFAQAPSIGKPTP